MNDIRTDAPEQGTGNALESTGWGLFLIWVGITLATKVGWGVGMFGVGLIVLGVQAARRFYRLRVKRFRLVLGACLAVAGALHARGIPVDLSPIAPWIIPGLLVAAGAAVLVSAFKRRSGD